MLGRFVRLCAVAAIGGGAVFLLQIADANDTVDSLAADPERLNEVQRLCSQDWAGTGDALCTAASQARRKRFMGSGTTPYTPHRVEMFPSLDKEGKPKADKGKAGPSSVPAVPNAE
ncbi:hypothetical protein ACUSIJ_27710 [Pseudochelatococcus sp. B33]